MDAIDLRMNVIQRKACIWINWIGSWVHEWKETVILILMAVTVFMHQSRHGVSDKKDVWYLYGFTKLAIPRIYGIGPLCIWWKQIAAMNLILWKLLAIIIIKQEIIGTAGKQPRNASFRPHFGLFVGIYIWTLLDILYKQLACIACIVWMVWEYSTNIVHTVMLYNFGLL